MDQTTSSQERRKNSRYSAAGQASLRWPGYSGEEFSTHAQVQDVSAEGLAVRVPEPLAVGQKVQVRLHEKDYPARIRRCRQQQSGFLASLQIVLHDADERWNWLYCRRFQD